MYYIPQVTRSGCGFTCLKMLLAIAHHDERYLYLKEDENHGPYSYQDLLVVAQRYNVTLIGVKYEDKSDLSHLNAFPLILTVENENQSPHAILITKRKGEKLFVQDPDGGCYWEKAQSIIDDWDGTALAINHVEDYSFNLRVVDAKDKRGDALSYLMQGLAALFIALATFFIKPDANLAFPIAFCALSLICEIILRMVLLKRMQKCDKYLRLFLPYVHKKDYFQYYKRSQEYKRSSLTMGLNFVFYLLVILLIVFVSLINSFTYVISISLAFLSAYIDMFIFTPFMRTIARDLSKQEEELHSVREQDDMELKVKSLEINSYRYAYLDFAKKIVVGAFFLAGSVFISMVEKTFSIPNIVFYTCVSVLIYQYLCPLLSYDYRVNDNMVNKAKVNNLIHQNDEKNSKMV